MASLTRGSLPPRVYWTRRLLVLGVALLLVFGFARLLGAGSDASSGPDQAAQVAAEPTGGPTAEKTKASKKQRAKNKKKKNAEPVLAEPQGACSARDIVVTPRVPQPIAGRDITIVLRLRTLTAEACTWQVSRWSLAVKISSGNDEIWASRQCPRAVPRDEVVIRKAAVTPLRMTWNAKRSNAECSKITDWALPGYYHVTAATPPGEPTSVQFELTTPPRPVITVTPEPTEKPKKAKNKKKRPNGGRPVTSGRG